MQAFDDHKGQRDTVVEDMKKSGNHQVNAHRGDDFGMTADQAELKLRAKLRENFAVCFIVIINILEHAASDSLGTLRIQCVAPLNSSNLIITLAYLTCTYL